MAKEKNSQSLSVMEPETKDSHRVVDKTKIPLRRVLGPGTVILLVVGNIIGTGIFKKIAPMAATGMSKNEILLAWLAAGIITMFGALTMAGLTKTTTVSGGFYEYMRLSLGKFTGFIYGWTIFTVIYTSAIAAIAFLFAQSINSIISLPNPLHSLAGISIGHFIYPFASSGIKIVAVGSIVLLTWYNSRGIKKGSILNNIVTIIKIAGILLIIIAGLWFTTTANGINPIISPSGVLKKQGFFAAFFAAALAAFWAYEGFADATIISGEIKNPKRNLPSGVIAGTGIVIILYLLINTAYMKAATLQQLGSIGENQIAASFIAGKIAGNTGNILISILVLLSSFGVLNLGILFAARLFYRMAQRKVFFRQAAKVHPKFKTPAVSMVFVMVWSIVLVFSGTFDMLTNLLVFIDFIFYALLAIGLIKLKLEKKLTGKIPGYPWAPVIFIVFISLLSINTIITQPKLSLIGIGLVLTGIPFYFYFNRKYKNLPVIDEEEEVE